jgi:predicted sugar kinase
LLPNRLSNSQGNLLDDTELIDVLAVTKQTAQDVSDKLANASETNKKINEACEEYRPVAHRATLIYFLIAEFAVVNCMYQTSLAQFNELYGHSIDNSEKASLPSKRIANIIEQMTYDIYLYIQVSWGAVLGACKLNILSSGKHAPASCAQQIMSLEGVCTRQPDNNCSAPCSAAFHPAPCSVACLNGTSCCWR